jgi:hypothetical protein
MSGGQRPAFGEKQDNKNWVIIFLLFQVSRQG